jgi:hypothetical protein
LSFSRFTEESSAGYFLLHFHSNNSFTRLCHFDQTKCAEKSRRSRTAGLQIRSTHKPHGRVAVPKSPEQPTGGFSRLPLRSHYFVPTSRGEMTRFNKPATYLELLFTLLNARHATTPIVIQSVAWNLGTAVRVCDCYCGNEAS